MSKYLKKWTGSRALLLDSGNNMFVMVEPGHLLRSRVRALQKLIENDGKDLCAGQIHLVTFGEVPIQLHLRKKPKKQLGCRWDVSLRKCT